MHAGTFYFSHRETTIVLVTGLNKSEQARKDDLISVTGDREKGAGDTDTLHYLVPMTKAAAHKPTGNFLILIFFNIYLFLISFEGSDQVLKVQSIMESMRRNVSLIAREGTNRVSKSMLTPKKEVVDPFERMATGVLSSSESFYKKRKLRLSESTSSTAAKSIEETSDLSKK
ncbi:hypothetical protein FEM48_ZijujUnG0010700 [Ziziphus jujuba var. spinosa]|uniref:Uncharacterized protein n=1 Tax=Ziziphus jujuba var. spinosa TaxID=714518 RepID=A0A978U9Y7_ZIZJJ|nr:hypothetical protein FEM48_ZijujUnG0010700 [Ziziphus jujuba var. spinosa]